VDLGYLFKNIFFLQLRKIPWVRRPWNIGQNFKWQSRED